MGVGGPKLQRRFQHHPKLTGDLAPPVVISDYRRRVWVDRDFPVRPLRRPLFEVSTSRYNALPLEGAFGFLRRKAEYPHVIY